MNSHVPNATGFALFALGFRPFYLLAALCAATLLPLWLAHYAGVMQIAQNLNGVWHAHEMIFGFAVAVVAGFLFTAARNWTGIDTPAGVALAGFCLLWLGGRILMLFGESALTAAVDIAFLPAVALALGRVLYRAKNKRNYFLLVMVLALAAFNVVFHLAATGRVAVAPMQALHWALSVVVVLVAVMGGRVIPFFTANVLPGLKQYRRAWLDYLAVASLIAAIVSAGSTGALPALVCFAAALANVARLAGWRGDATLRRPILWILHLAYAWIPAGLLLLGLSALGYAPEVLAWHAFAIGAIGGAIIAMITRTARGHTGSPLIASRFDVLSYVLMTGAAAVRVFVPLVVPQYYLAAVMVSGALWTLAFAIYFVTYAPLLWRARLDGKPG